MASVRRAEATCSGMEPVAKVSKLRKNSGTTLWCWTISSRYSQRIALPASDRIRSPSADSCGQRRHASTRSNSGFIAHQNYGRYARLRQVAYWLLPGGCGTLGVSSEALLPNRSAGTARVAVAE